MAQYRTLVGIDYPPNKRVEAGEVVSDLPGDSIKWLLESGAIEPVDGKKDTPKTKDEPKEVIKSDAIEGADAVEAPIAKENTEKVGE